jgi:hypothetical protein
VSEVVMGTVSASAVCPLFGHGPMIVDPPVMLFVYHVFFTKRKGDDIPP